MNRHFVVLACWLSWCLSGCTPTVDSAQVNLTAASAGDPLLIGVGWPLSGKQDFFRHGIELAIEDLNARGGVLGRPIQAVFRDDKSEVSTGKSIAQSFAEDPKIEIVIGHYDSFISLPAAITYEYYGLLMISPGTTDPKLTEQGFERVFRTVPSDLQVGSQLAEIARDRGHKKMVIIYEQSGYGRQLANAIEFRSEELRLKISDRVSYDPGIVDYRLIFATLRLIEYDGVFFAGLGEDARSFIAEARDRGIDKVFLGGNGLDTRRLFGQDPDAAEGTLVLSVFHMDNPNPYVQYFRKHFQDTHGEEPDAWAAQGYDAVQLLAHAIRHAQSTVPDQIAAALNHLDSWYGVTGQHSFDEKGDVQGKAMVMKIARNGKLEFHSH